MKNLVIVESPAKAKTISKFLGNDFIVMASMGHVRDLPKSSLGFDPNDNFKPKYQISTDKKKVITDLKKHISKDTTIYLAADEDREGEAIAWHLIPALKIEKNPIKRIVFHEITKDAILKALENPRDVDQNLVDAQQARRILDRAVGYELSPLLWKKVRYGLSAGRVQSVAVRIIVDRENEIRAFVPEEYWKIKADFINPELKAELAKENGKTLKISNEKQALEIEASLKQGSYKLVDIEEKESTRNPAAPFTTSTLQQEASRKLGFSVKQTMIIAQQLYEGNVGNIPNHTGGLITYMRTDSLNLSTVATTAAKAVIEEEYGKEYALNKPRVYTTKSKGAQEAHEAIRPVNLALRPSQIKEFVEPAQYRLYSLIWKRTLATQMAQAKIANTTYKIEAGKNKEFEFQVKGQRIIFAGFMKAYTEGSDNPEAALDSSEKILPNIKEGTILELEKLESEQNFTKPPARYTEASLVKKLESEGIGRPSTYAPTISTIQAREYVSKTED
ncbi:type I DNA topoisomerase, partial [Aliarcobacter butzleri]|nr:type I DNA topoisomerase [Aliarcobacter butzleri]